MGESNSTLTANSLKPKFLSRPVWAETLGPTPARVHGSPRRGDGGGSQKRDYGQCTPQRGAGGEVSTEVVTGAPLAPPEGEALFSLTAGREEQGA